MRKSTHLLNSAILMLSFFIAPLVKSQTVYSFETNTTNWQSQTSGGVWNNAIAASPSSGFLSTVQSKGFTTATNSNLIWGSTYSSGTKAGYTTSNQDSFVTRSADFVKLRTLFSIPDTTCKIDSARIWLICDDGIDSVWINNTLVLNTPILFYGLNYVTAKIPGNLLTNSNNQLDVKAVNFILNYALYAKVEVYYKKKGTCCAAIQYADSLDLVSNVPNWQSQNSSGVWGSANSGSPSSGFLTFVQSKGFTNATSSNFIWGSTYSSGTKTNYTTSAQTTTANTSATFIKVRNKFSFPDSICEIDSARIWLICDDGIDSVWLNNTLVLNTPILFYDINYVTASIPGNLFSKSNNELVVRAVDYMAYYSLYSKLRIYYKKGNCCLPTSIADPSSINEVFDVYPNPAKDKLVIDLKTLDKTALAYEIVNTIGQTVVPSKLFGNEGGEIINTALLQDGIYFVRLMENDKVIQVKKVVIQK